MKDSALAQSLNAKDAASYEDFPAEWYSLSDAQHFWMQWRLASWRALMARRGVDLSGSFRALDVGCGVGTFRGQVEGITGWTVDGIDMHPLAPVHAKPGRGWVRQQDIFAVPESMVGAYDHVFLFDVLEHLPDPRVFTTAALRCLKLGGLLHVNVPALASLFSAYDVAAGHIRRYSVRSLVDELKVQDLSEVTCRYWGLSLVPLLVLRKGWLTLRHAEAVIRSGFRPPGRLAHEALRAQMRLETAILPLTPLGTSVIFTAQKVAPR